MSSCLRLLPRSWVFAALAGAAGCGGNSASEDPCARASCAPNASCTAVDAAAVCSCPSGFSDVHGDGSECVDVCNEANPCSADATCSNTTGAVECTCLPGFAGDGFSCADIDECLEGTDNCHVDAVCDNSAGAFTCTCLPLYSGDGVTCAPPPSTWSVLGGARSGSELVVDAKGIYGIGRDPFESPSGTTYRLEKRSRENGDRSWFTSGFSEFNAVATDGSTVFVAGTKKEVGFDRYRWWIQGFDEADGTPGPEAFIEITTGIDRVRDLAVHGDSIYAFGEIPKNASTSATQWHLKKHLRSSLGVTWSVSNNITSGSDVASALAVDDTGVYIAGTPDGIFGDDTAWQIEKRSLVDGSVIWSKTSNPSSLEDYARAVAVDATGVYVAGNDWISPGNPRWRIEKRALDTGDLLWNMTFAEASDGSFGQPGIPSIRALSADASGVYVIGNYRPGGSGSDWKLMLLSAADGSVIWSHAGGTPYGRTPGGIAIDPQSVYLLGTEATSYKFEKRHKSTGDF